MSLLEEYCNEFYSDINYSGLIYIDFEIDNGYGLIVFQNLVINFEAGMGYYYLDDIFEDLNCVSFWEQFTFHSQMRRRFLVDLPH